ncbi:hypothetical protein BDV23DRAFT_184279 [Aspergillus alliaceus]|uniref:Uncharacterized protein n=1 Tax=Petromyces alliaceus TaxID=209559 RepID=A0A5N7C708_PETAA|nr:hypothetical protein BDV23DRAFT_184279 [Aspergillus alliaceus]
MALVSPLFRLHLVWQLHTLGKLTHKILTTPIYVESGGIASLGRHERAFVYQGLAKDIIQAESSGDIIWRVANTDEERGESLVMGKLVSIVIQILTDKHSVGAR